MSECCTRKPAHLQDRGGRGGLMATLASVAVAALAVTLLVAVRLAPFFTLQTGSDDAASGAATQPCC